MSFLNTTIATTQQLIVATQKYIHCLFMAIEVPQAQMLTVANLIEEAEKSTNLETLFKISAKLETFKKNEAIFIAEQKQLTGLTSLRAF